MTTTKIKHELFMFLIRLFGLIFHFNFSLFPGGAGDMTVFCSKGRQLVRSLQNKTANILASFHMGAGHHRARRISRSEGDLRVVCDQVARNHAQAEDTMVAASLPQRNTHQV